MESPLVNRELNQPFSDGRPWAPAATLAGELTHRGGRWEGLYSASPPVDPSAATVPKRGGRTPWQRRGAQPAFCLSTTAWRGATCVCQWFHGAGSNTAGGRRGRRDCGRGALRAEHRDTNATRCLAPERRMPQLNPRWGEGYFGSRGYRATITAPEASPTSWNGPGARESKRTGEEQTASSEALLLSDERPFAGAFGVHILANCSRAWT